ncbi:tyrosine-type recombinase/integrase [Nonomuraea turkmeniaca]|uniref:tyrosine-type recombinase/integrase n=1 Tax=Nonomuraea turkmeniaca TaxID=103838 RepID=UPI001B881E1E|nr:tyrosine-type recombinase/integrase [Nonomuraea turkmeniaca]
MTAAGQNQPVYGLDPQTYAAVMARWDERAPATWNKHLSALRSFAAYAIRNEWITADPARHLERRKITQRGDQAVPQARLEALFTDDRNTLRERVLWRLLYDTAARAEEILTLDIGDLDLEFRRARTRSKGGDTEYLHWATATARLLPRLLAGRTAGPVFLAERRSPASGKRARALTDIDPVSGRGRLSYPRAEYLFKQASVRHDPHGSGWRPAPTAALRAQASGRQRPQRPRTAGQEPPQAPGHSRALRPARRGDLRPPHRRQRPARPPSPSLTGDEVSAAPR